MASIPSSRVLPALVCGAATAAYYASPDVIASRTARGWTKTALAAVVVATSVPDARAALAEMRGTRRQGAAVTAAAAEPPATRGKVVAIAAGIGVVAAAVGFVVVVERWIFRRGEARAAAGQRWAHTGPAVVLGALAAGLALVPLPTDPVPPGEGAGGPRSCLDDPGQQKAVRRASPSRY